jgi:hypothetical protein
VTEEFDRFLAAALAPPLREPDRAFVAHVQGEVALEQRFAAERSSLGRELAQQLIALFAVGAGAWWLGRSAPVADWAAESPATALATLVVAFMFLAAMFTMRPRSGNVPEWRI